ncbi:exosortase/archaeosortase family protein, partial [Puniceicoccaceae bacterium]|nr:exosortase/archaeosortase family protein [Puniceicoccaceae bacterium]
MSTDTQNQTFKNLLPEQVIAACLMAGFAIYTAWDQLFWWGNREDYSFGYLVPIFASYVLYERWPNIRSYLFRGAPSGVPMPAPGVRDAKVQVLEWVAIAAFGASLLLFGIGALLRAATGPQNPASLAISLSLGG